MVCALGFRWIDRGSGIVAVMQHLDRGAVAEAAAEPFTVALTRVAPGLIRRPGTDLFVVRSRDFSLVVYRTTSP